MLQGFHVPGAGNGIGPAGDVLFAAGPNANQEWLNANFGVGGRYYKQPTGEQAADDAAGEAASGRAAGYKAAMADGKIGRKDIQAYMDKKGIKGDKQNNAQLRIADRWSSRGGLLGQGVLKDYLGNFETKNPWASFTNQRFNEDGLTFAALGKNRSQNELYSAGRSMLDGKGYAKGDVFARLKDGTLRGQQRINTGLGIGSGAGTGTGDGAGTDTGTGGIGDGIDSGLGDVGGATGDTGISGMTGGSNSLTGTNNLGYKRKKSSWHESGRNSRGTANAARSNFALGINTGLK
jgi:hypothetical protein